MTAAVELKQVKKSYGAKTALQDITFQVKTGSCFGLLGPNGAGKSTTMKILSGLLEADQGTIGIFGNDVRHSGAEVKRMVGYVPQSITLYEKLNAIDNLLFFGQQYGVRGAALKKKIAEVLEKVGLAERAKEPVEHFSGGMKRRINIAAALLHDPKLLIMDEPTVGIDPQSRNHIFEMIRELKRSGVTVLYSTHYMEEVEALCDDLAIIDHGKLIASGALGQVLDEHGTDAVYLEAEGVSGPPATADGEKTSAKGQGWIYETSSPLDTIADLAASCKQRGLSVKRLEIVRPSLESVFLTLTGTTLRDS